MPMPQSALDGIKRFGLGWRWPNGPRIAEHAGTIGRLTDNGIESEDDEEAIVRAAHAIGEAVCAWFSALGTRIHPVSRELTELYQSHHAEDVQFLESLTLEEVSEDPEGTLEEITSRLDSLWDTFDFYRVRVR